MALIQCRNQHVRVIFRALLTINHCNVQSVRVLYLSATNQRIVLAPFLLQATTSTL